MSTSYGWEQLRAAIIVLVSEGTIQVRLGRAWVGALIKLQPEDLPEALRPEFIRLRDEVQDGLGDLMEQTLAMSQRDAVAHAKRVFELFHELMRTSRPY